MSGIKRKHDEQANELEAKLDVILGQPSSPKTKEDVENARKRLRQEAKKEEPDFEVVQGLVRLLEKCKSMSAKNDALEIELAEENKKVHILEAQITEQEETIQDHYRRKYTAMIGDSVAGVLHYIKYLEKHSKAIEKEETQWKKEYLAWKDSPSQTEKNDSKMWKAIGGDQTRVYFPRMRKERDKLREWKQKKLDHPGMTEHHPQIPHLVRLKSIEEEAAKEGLTLTLDFMWKLFELYEERNFLAHSDLPILADYVFPSLPENVSDKDAINWHDLYWKRKQICSEIQNAGWIMADDKEFGKSAYKAWELTLRAAQWGNGGTVTLTDFGKERAREAVADATRRVLIPMRRHLTWDYLCSIFPQDVGQSGVSAE